MDVLDNIAKKFISDVNGDGKIDIADVKISLGQLLTDSSTGKLDFGLLVSKLKNSELSNTVTSWLGDGKNDSLSVDSLSQLFDTDQLTKFASSLNLDINTAKTALTEAIPNLIDQISSGGNLLDRFTEQAAKFQADVLDKAAKLQAEVMEKAASLKADVTEKAASIQAEVSEHVEKLQTEANEVADAVKTAAQEKSSGLLGKIKNLLGL